MARNQIYKQADILRVVKLTFSHQLFPREFFIKLYIYHRIISRKQFLHLLWILLYCSE